MDTTDHNSKKDERVRHLARCNGLGMTPANYAFSGDPLAAIAIAVVENAVLESRKCPQAREWLAQVRRDIAEQRPDRFRVEPEPTEEAPSLGLAELGELMRRQTKAQG